MQLTLWARSEVGLSRLPVTEEIAGSNPVGPATKQVHLRWWTFFVPVRLDSNRRGEQSEQIAGSVKRERKLVLARVPFERKSVAISGQTLLP
jgi:hypothetical protein